MCYSGIPGILLNVYLYLASLQSSETVQFEDILAVQVLGVAVEVVFCIYMASIWIFCQFQILA